LPSAPRKRAAFGRAPSVYPKLWMVVTAPEESMLKIVPTPLTPPQLVVP
jgi:hypothetical protein